MTYKDGSWGLKAKERSRKRREYFSQYRKDHPQEQKREYIKKHNIPDQMSKRKHGNSGINNPMYGKTKKDCPNWKGGRISLEGYINIYMPDHPCVKSNKYISEHRLMMENWLKNHNPENPYLIEIEGYKGKWLSPMAVIHHINGIKDDNRIENLMLFASNKEHRGYHNKMKEGNKVGNY